MDVDALISAIQNRPLIWDKKMKDHSNRVKVEKAWKEISKEVGGEESVIRKKWKSLRDYFALGCTKLLRNRSGDSENRNRAFTWVYFDQLAFLKDHIMTPRISSNSLNDLFDNHPSPSSQEAATCIASCSIPNTTVTDHTILECDCDELKSEEGAIDEDVIQGGDRKRKRNNQSVYNKELFEIENKMLKYSKDERNDDDDDDLLFMKSLLPYVKRIPLHLKLSFRNSVQLTVEEYAFGSQAL